MGLCLDQELTVFRKLIPAYALIDPSSLGSHHILTANPQGSHYHKKGVVLQEAAASLQTIPSAVDPSALEGWILAHVACTK